jgi:hypothetical protein
MKNPCENKRLLSDVLAEGADESFRDALLGQTLRLAKRRRHFRKARRAGLGFAIVAGLVLIASHFFAPDAPGRKTVERPSFVNTSAKDGPYRLVLTQALPSTSVITTRSSRSVTVATSGGNIQIVTTTAAPHDVRQLDDDELLALLPSPALLVRRGGHSAELLFANPGDRDAFLQN